MSIATLIRLWLRQRRAVKQWLHLFRRMTINYLLWSLQTGVPDMVDCQGVSLSVSIYDSCIFGALDLRPLRPAPSLPPSLFLSTVLLDVLSRLLADADTVPGPTTPSSCVALVTMPSDSPPTLARWLDIWEAAVAVNTMCIQHGFTGKAVWLGKSHREYMGFSFYC